MAAPPSEAPMLEETRQTQIVIRGAKEHNLKNVNVEIPREKLVVFTGVSGSGKSSLAFDTLFAEGQRRFLESLDAYTKRFASQLKKPDVDMVYGLSPVISIEQKTVNKNPRSTLGTMTDIYDYLRLLYATIGVGHCAFCDREIPIKSPIQMLERLLSLPEGTSVEIIAPVTRIYGEDYPYLLGEIRAKGCRRIRIDNELLDLSENIELDEDHDYRIEAIVDKVAVKRDMRTLERQIQQSIQAALKIGEGFVRFHLVNATEAEQAAFDKDFACPEHGLVIGELLPYFFSFNEPESACLTCAGLGVYRVVEPDFLTPDKSRSIKQGAFIPEAFKWERDSWGARLMYSCAQHFGIDLDIPYQELPTEALDILLHGSKGERFPVILPPGAKIGEQYIGKLFRWDGIVNDIERRYRRYRKEKASNSWMEDYLKRVMVDQECPECQGTRLKASRLKVTLKGIDIFKLCEMPLEDLTEYLKDIPTNARQSKAGKHVLSEVQKRVELLQAIGLGYLSLGRKAATLSGGESQRTRLSTQISSGLMGMLYVLDEPSIGLHPRDNDRLINTLKRLRNLGNTVIVVEHDEAMMRAADYLIEMGPGPGVHGGEVVAFGTAEDLAASPLSLTGKYLSGELKIEVPERRRPINPEKMIMVRGARQNNLRGVDASFPLGVLTAVTGVSGSGKSTLVNDILYKRLYAHFYDSRTRSGNHDGIAGLEHITDVIAIDQTPLGRSPRSNPATYIGVYDEIRHLFSALPESVERGYTPGRFSFNVRGGRCEECAGEGIVVTSLHFMPDVEAPCPSCKGSRYNEETMEILYRDHSIADILAMPIEEAADFFEKHALIAHKLDTLCQLGLGYIQLGQSCTTLSGGEAQRVKLGFELSKVKRGGKKFYILDEPTTGLHLSDIRKLLDALQRLVDAGNTVLVIEHHLDVIKTADYLIDLGPEGGRNGGLIIATGTPEQVAENPISHTGHCLREVL